MTTIGLPKWNKEYAFVDPNTRTLARTTDGLLDKMTLNIFQRIARTCFGWYANTHLKVVGNAARIALFDPNFTSRTLCQKAIIDLAKKHFEGQNLFYKISNELYLGAERLGDGKTVIYEAFFEAPAWGKASELSKPHIRITLQQIDYLNQPESEHKVTLGFSKSHTPHYIDTVNGIDVNCINPGSDQISYNLTDDFLRALISSSKMNQLLLKTHKEEELCNPKSEYLKQKEYSEIKEWHKDPGSPATEKVLLKDILRNYQLNPPFSLDFLLLLNQSN